MAAQQVQDEDRHGAPCEVDQGMRHSYYPLRGILNGRVIHVTWKGRSDYKYTQCDPHFVQVDASYV